MLAQGFLEKQQCMSYASETFLGQTVRRTSESNMYYLCICYFICICLFSRTQECQLPKLVGSVGRHSHSLSLWFFLVQSQLCIDIWLCFEKYCLWYACSMLVVCLWHACCPCSVRLLSSVIHSSYAPCMLAHAHPLEICHPLEHPLEYHGPSNNTSLAWA
jgi:hypothetical protein